jgi:hypothetical protein
MSYGVFGNLGGGAMSMATRAPDPTTTPQPLRPAGWGGHHARPIATSIFGGGVYQGDALRPVSLQPTLQPGAMHGFGAYMIPGPAGMPISEMAPRQIAITHPAMRTLPIGRATVAYGEYMMAPGYSGFGGLTGFGS